MNLNEASLKTLEKLEAKLIADLEAVRRIITLIKKGQTPSIGSLLGLVSTDAISNIETSSSIGELKFDTKAPVKVAALVRQAVTELNGSFGIGDVKARIRMHSERTFGDVAIRHQLKTMEQEGELVLTFQGVGRGGNQYAKTSRFQLSPLL